MKVLSKIAGLSRKAIVLSVLTAAVVGVAGFKAANVEAQNISIGGASDCDSNAVMWCGAHSVDGLIHKYKNGDGHNGSGSIKNIFNHFGIQQADVLAMNDASTHVERGSVSKSGNVYDNNGKVIAKNALTAGRSYIAGSNHVTRNGTSFYTRPPSVSFISNTLEAYVVTKNGVFQFAILAACGNPVTGTPTPPPAPTPQPNYNVEKHVKVKGTDNFKKSVNVKPGTHVIYSVDVKSTGKAPVKNVTVKDNLPAHVQYVNGTLKRDGTELTGQANKFFSSGIVIDSIAPGTVKHFTFEAIVGPNENPQTCKDERLTNVAKINAPSLPPQDSNADVSKECKPPTPKPQSVACESLQGYAGSRIAYGFVAKATTVNGAKVTGYTFNFGDGQSSTVTTNALTAGVFHAYPDLDVEKSYTATVTVNAILKGKVVHVTAPACAAPVKISPLPPKPSYAECTELKLTVGQNRSITAETKVATKGNASLVSINYNFDDGTSLLVNNLQPVSHTYAADGTYIVKASVTFNVDGQNQTTLCQAPVVFTPPTPPTCEEQNGGQSCETCQEQNGGQPCEETPTCEETVAEQGKGVCEEVPTTLVNTGPGETAAMFAAVTVLGAIGYRILLSRRLSQQ